MNDYAVKKALAKRGGQVNNGSAAAQSVNGIPNSVLTDVFAGKRKASSEMMGHREELAPSIAAKMSQSFGMDFSAVKVYRSDAMAGTEMHGMAQGDKVVLSSDVDLNTQAGQATLGHELSHIRAQSMGMGSGRGLLNDAALEHQADSEGMLAARGMNIGGESMGMSGGLGMAGVEGLSPIGAGLGASAAAPMQASKTIGTTDNRYATSPRELTLYQFHKHGRFSKAKGHGYGRGDFLKEVMQNDNGSYQERSKYGMLKANHKSLSKVMFGGSGGKGSDNSLSEMSKHLDQYYLKKDQSSKGVFRKTGSEMIAPDKLASLNQLKAELKQQRALQQNNLQNNEASETNLSNFGRERLKADKQRKALEEQINKGEVSFLEAEYLLEALKYKSGLGITPILEDSE